MTLLDVLGELTRDEDLGALGKWSLSFFTTAVADNCVQLAAVGNLASRTTETSVCIKPDAIACTTLIALKSASVDEHLQRVGAESFDLFQRFAATLSHVFVPSFLTARFIAGESTTWIRRWVDVDRIISRAHGLIHHFFQLRNFSNAARQLGSSVGILSSAFHLRERLAQITWLFRENAADLFPRKVSHQSTTESVVKPDVLPRRKRVRSKAPPHVRRPLVLEKLDPEVFPHQFGLFAKDVITFLHCLNEFPEFTDEALNASIVAFEGDLKVRPRHTHALLNKDATLNLLQVLGVLLESL